MVHSAEFARGYIQRAVYYRQRHGGGMNVVNVEDRNAARARPGRVGVAAAGGVGGSLLRRSRARD